MPIPQDYEAELRTTYEALECLTDNRRRVLELLVEGKSSKQIALALDMSPRAVDDYRVRLYEAFNVSSPAQLGYVYGRYTILHNLHRRP